MANPTMGIKEVLDELIKIHKINMKVILRDDISVRDIVELRVHDKHETVIPMVSHSGELLWTRELVHTNGATKEVIRVTKESRLMKLEPGTVTTGLVIRKQYVTKTDKTPQLAYSIQVGEIYPVYDLLCPEGIVRFDLHGETHLETIFVDWLYVRKLRSLV